MLKPGLERFDSPIVMVNQQFEDQDWGITATYCSPLDVTQSEGELSDADVGWHASVTLPDYDDVDLDGIFASPESAIDFAIERILSGALAAAVAEPPREEHDEHALGNYTSIA